MKNCSHFIVKSCHKLSTISFNNVYSSSSIVLFISEKSLLLRSLFMLRYDGLYIINGKSCRVVINSGSYISFHFKTANQVLKFLELNYFFEKFSGLVLINQTFLNCSFVQLKQILFNKISSMYIFSLL